MSSSREWLKLPTFEETLERLRRNDPNHTRLELRGKQIDADKARALANALQKNTTLTELTLIHDDIGVEGARELANALQNNNTTALTKLRLMHDDIGVEGARALASALETNTTLHDLYLNKNNIGVEGARALTRALEKNTALTVLGLENNQIGAEGARALANALETNNTLEKLNLCDNGYMCDHGIGPEGARALANALAYKNTVLIHLDVNGNKIQDEGARALADALHKNTTLTSLAFMLDNEIEDEGVKENIFQLLDRNNAKDDDWEAAVIAKAQVVPNEKLTEEEEKIAAWAAERRQRKRNYIVLWGAGPWERKRKEKAEKEEAIKQKYMEEGRNQLKAELKRKAKEEAEEAKRATVPIIPPKECKIMISFNDQSAGEDAELLTKYLTRNGHPTFCTRLYCPNMTGNWRIVTTQGVKHCKYYIMLMDKRWQESKECQFETKMAINRWAKEELTPIPVWYDDFDFDYDEVVDGHLYADQFGSVQSVQRKRTTWMKVILKQLEGATEGTSLETANEEQEENANEKHEESVPSSSTILRREFWAHAAIATAAVSLAIGLSRRKS